MRSFALPLVSCLWALLGPLAAFGADEIPHAQDRPPGPPLSAQEALSKMTVPEGFQVELFASEPDIVNPIAMTFDERGRIWITESLEYPRRDAGPGRDRVKVIEDTDGDGRADSFTIFAEGLNIPCGVALGNGGVFVTNSPDILFLRDTDGDGKADQQEVILTGFGRYDTHELPNTLTWGPDGWLYGLNGVFNGARVVHQNKEHRFDAALWRYHPRTRAFELFAQGTSNPWGIAFDRQGSAFVSACVIDHLYHLVETGYYHRQAGAYPPFTWKIESVVDHKHQKAAYCGLALYDADAYPEQYRGRLFMGNIHGNCINVDRLERDGATYTSRGEADFLSANDAWFMPVVTKLGPDGCFYVLDWYDRYHCYQDANRDPKGIDRLKGRLYRIAYRGSPRAGKLDLAAEASEKLVDRLAAPNLWWRNETQRILAERLARTGDAGLAARLREAVLQEAAPETRRRHALWTLISAEDPDREPRFIEEPFLLSLLSHKDPFLRAWGTRAAGGLRRVGAPVKGRIRELARDAEPDVRLQVAIAARKLFNDREAQGLLFEIAAASESDPLIPQVAWRNLEPLLEDGAGDAARWMTGGGQERFTSLAPIAGRVVERLLARKARDLDAPGSIVRAALSHRASAPRAAAECLQALSQSVLAGGGGSESDGASAQLREALAPVLEELLASPERDALYFQALQVAASWGDARAIEEARKVLLDRGAKSEWRIRCLQALAASRGPALVEAARALLKDPAGAGEELLRELLGTLGKLQAPEVAALVLETAAGLPAAIRPQAIDILTARPAWAGLLLDAVDSKRIERTSINMNQVRRILALEDEALGARVERVWGQVRMERSPERERVIARMRRALDKGPGDPWRGKAVYEKTCAQCHVLFGRGQTVGPDISVNGRETLDALLSNLLDPNLVIGKGYYASTLVDKSGRVLSGLLVEDSTQRVVLKVAGGKEEAVPREQVRMLQASEVSLMPEDLEKTIQEGEFRDLIAYLRYEEAPPEPIEVHKVPGAPGTARRVAAEQEYGVLKVLAVDGGSRTPIVEYHHSGDGRPYLHPVRAPGGGPVVTALRPDDHPWQYGVFTGHARVGDLDFWHEKGWIRSRGLEALRELPDRVEILARSDWLSQRRGGKRILSERQTIVVHAPAASGDRQRIDFDWELTPDEDVTLGQYDYGGFSFRPAGHQDRKNASAEGQDGNPWFDVSGLFEGKDGARQPYGAAIFDHPQNAGYPNRWRADGQGLINPAITARGPLKLSAGKPVLFRYRLLIHRGYGDGKMLEEEHRLWTRR